LSNLTLITVRSSKGNFWIINLIKDAVISLERRHKKNLKYSGYFKIKLNEPIFLIIRIFHFNNKICIYQFNVKIIL